MLGSRRMNSMHKLLGVALGAGFILAGCSSNGGSFLPSATSLQPSNLGAHTTRGPHVALAPLGWAATATQAFNLSNASDLGALPASQTITVRLGLQMRSPDQLASLVASGQQISGGTFNATYAPTATQVNAATSYLQSHGFSNVSVEPNNLLVSATGTAAQASQAFHTTLHAFSQNG